MQLIMYAVYIKLVCAQEFAPIMRVLGSFPREVVPDSLSMARLDTATALQQLALSAQPEQPASVSQAEQAGPLRPAASQAAAEDAGSNGSLQPSQPETTQQAVGLKARPPCCFVCWR